MPRRYAPKRRLIRRKRLARRPMRRILRRRPAQPVQLFKRVQYLTGFLSNNTASDTYGSMTFNLNSVPGASEFTHLYDQYMIKALKVSFIPRGTTSDLGNPVALPGYTGQSVGVFSVIDYDDNDNPTSIQQLCEYQNMKMTRSHQVHSRYFKPKLLMAGPTTSAGTVIGSTMVRKVQWIDCDSVLVPHYGLKYALQQAPNVAQQFDVKVEYYLAFKNVR